MSFQKAEIGRIDNVRSIVFSEGETINTLLTRAGLTLSRDEVVTDLRGDLVENNELAEGGETYVVTQNYKSGSY